MDTFVNEKDFELLEQDRYTFAVLDRILRGSCELVRSNHRDLIMCHSEGHYPVWFWTPDGCADEIKEKAWELANELRPFASGYKYNIKHELAEYFMERAKRENLHIRISMQLFAYDCPDPVRPDCPAAGELYCCTQEDMEAVVSMMDHFYDDIGEKPPTENRVREKAQMFIDDHSFFFWKDAEGNTAACCSYRCNQGLACIGSVYTRPECRRRHYAQNMVYEVTEKVKAMGFLPMLYTDAGYAASNACYEKIGYVLRGRLCTVAKA